MNRKIEWGFQPLQSVELTGLLRLNDYSAWILEDPTDEHWDDLDGWLKMFQGVEVTIRIERTIHHQNPE